MPTPIHVVTNGIDPARFTECEQRQLISTRALLQTKRRAYERKKRLYEDQLVTLSELEKAREEVITLFAKITEDDKITEWKAELTKLDKTVIPNTTKAASSGSPLLRQILFKKLELELDQTHIEKSRLQLEGQIVHRREKLATIQRLLSDFESLEDEVTTLDNRRQLLERKADALAQLAAYGPVEFTVIAPPVKPRYALKSNRKKLFAFCTGSLVLLSLTIVAGYDALRCGIVPIDAQVVQLGLPIVSRLNSMSREHGNETTSAPEAIDEVADAAVVDEIRGLALQLRQTLQEAGTIVMFSSLSKEQPLIQCVSQLAACLAARDERVVIVDTRRCRDRVGEFIRIVDAAAALAPFSEFQAGIDTSDDLESWRPPGLHDWLAFRFDEVAEVTAPTKFPGVDCILPGEQTQHEDLATVRMGELIGALRAKYSLVLLVGPAAHESTDVQIVAAHADGLLFPFDPSQMIEADCKATITTLIEMSAPVIRAIEM